MLSNYLTKYKNKLVGKYKHYRRRLILIAQNAFAMGDPNIDKKVIQSAIRFIYKSSGRKISYRKHKVISEVKTYDSARVFWTLMLTDGQKNIPVFVKSGKLNIKPYQLLRALSDKPLPIPKFYGHIYRRGHVYSFWEYIQGQTLAGFGHYNDSLLVNAASQIAKFNILGARALKSKKFGRELLWSSNIADAIAEMLKKSDKGSDLIKIFNDFSRCEKIMINILESDERLVLNHNDCKPSNLVINDKGEVLITDLDSCTLGPPGITMRCFTNLSLVKRKMVINSYVKALESYSFKVEPHKIHFVMFIQQVMWAMSTGIQFNEFERVKRGLVLFSKNFSLSEDNLQLIGVGSIDKELSFYSD